MRRIFQLSTLGILAGVASACNPDRVVATQSPVFASVRFINAVPDTGAAFGLDFRFVDIVENSDAFRITFRNTPSTSGAVVAGAQIEYKPARVVAPFPHLPQRFAPVRRDDGAQGLDGDPRAGHNYTFLLWGNARSTGSDKMSLTVIDENVADPGQQVALRVINASGTADRRSAVSATGTVPAARIGRTWPRTASRPTRPWRRHRSSSTSSQQVVARHFSPIRKRLWAKPSEPPRLRAREQDVPWASTAT